PRERLRGDRGVEAGRPDPRRHAFSRERLRHLPDGLPARLGRARDLRDREADRPPSDLRPRARGRGLLPQTFRCRPAPRVRAPGRRARPEARRRVKLERIVVATDFSEPARAALDRAVALAARFQARLYLFHAVDARGIEDVDAYRDGTLEDLYELAERRA